MLGWTSRKLTAWDVHVLSVIVIHVYFRQCVNEWMDVCTTWNSSKTVELYVGRRLHDICMYNKQHPKSDDLCVLLDSWTHWRMTQLTALVKTRKLSCYGVRTHHENGKWCCAKVIVRCVRERGQDSWCEFTTLQTGYSDWDTSYTYIVT